VVARMSTRFADAIGHEQHGGQVFRAARELGCDWRDILDFSANINPLGLPDSARRALTDSLDAVVHYPESGAPGVQAAAAKAWGLPTAGILVGNGATELIHSLIRTLTPCRAHLVVPTFSEYRCALDECTVSTTTWDHRAGNETNLDHIVSDAAEQDADLLILTNPNNPTGHVISNETLAANLIGRLPAAIRILVDESFIDFTHQPSLAELRKLHGLFILRSFTKFYAMPGLRIGCLVGEPGDIADLAASRAPWQTNILAEKATEAALADTDYQARSLALVEKERAWLSQRLADLPGIEPLPSAANFIFCRCVTPVDQIAKQLLLVRILIRDCTATEGIEGGAFRVGVRTRAENERLIASMEKILG